MYVCMYEPPNSKVARLCCDSLGLDRIKGRKRWVFLWSMSIKESIIDNTSHKLLITDAVAGSKKERNGQTLTVCLY